MREGPGSFRAAQTHTYPLGRRHRAVRGGGEGHQHSPRVSLFINRQEMDTWAGKHLPRSEHSQGAEDSLWGPGFQGVPSLGYSQSCSSSFLPPVSSAHKLLLSACAHSCTHAPSTMPARAPRAWLSLRPGFLPLPGQGGEVWVLPQTCCERVGSPSETWAERDLLEGG